MAEDQPYPADDGQKLTAQQEAEVDRMVDQGITNYGEAMRMIGAVSTEQTAEAGTTSVEQKIKHASSPRLKNWRERDWADRGQYTSEKPFPYGHG